MKLKDCGTTLLWQYAPTNVQFVCGKNSYAFHRRGNDSISIEEFLRENEDKEIVDKYYCPINNTKTFLQVFLK